MGFQLSFNEGNVCFLIRSRDQIVLLSLIKLSKDLGTTRIFDVHVHSHIVY